MVLMRPSRNLVQPTILPRSAAWTTADVTFSSSARSPSEVAVQLQPKRDGAQSPSLLFKFTPRFELHYGWNPMKLRSYTFYLAFACCLPLGVCQTPTTAPDSTPLIQQRLAKSQEYM